MKIELIFFFSAAECTVARHFIQAIIISSTMCSEAELGNAERSSHAKLFDPAIHFTLLEDGACTQKKALAF